MVKHLPARMLFEIGVLRCRAIDNGKLVNVYSEAEKDSPAYSRRQRRPGGHR
jgi:hypothetical protein